MDMKELEILMDFRVKPQIHSDDLGFTQGGVFNVDDINKITQN